jgi:hypothetical protein
MESLKRQDFEGEKMEKRSREQKRNLNFAIVEP